MRGIPICKSRDRIYIYIYPIYNIHLYTYGIGLLEDLQALHFGMRGAPVREVSHQRQVHRTAVPLVVLQQGEDVHLNL